MFEQLVQSIAQSERNHHQFAVHFIDLDRFKIINDTYGYKAGDLVLQETAVRMKSHVRKSDVLASIGGDEFIALIRDIDNQETVSMIAEKLITIINKPLLI